MDSPELTLNVLESHLWESAINLPHARELIETFREDYNQYRPHSSLGGLTPAKFAARQIAPGPLGGPLDRNLSLAVPTLNPQPHDHLGLSF